MAEGISFNESQRGTNSPQIVDRFFHPFKNLSRKRKRKKKTKERRKERSHTTHSRRSSCNRPFFISLKSLIFVFKGTTKTVQTKSWKAYPPPPPLFLRKLIKVQRNKVVLIQKPNACLVTSES